MTLEIWDKLKQPPEWALRKIEAGRLKGKSDINPQWRYKAMTELFGPCGIGWKYEIDGTTFKEFSNDERFVGVKIKLYFKHNGEWSEPIPGFGGDIIYKQEKNGPYLNDEAYKMALTDALGAAMKMIGVAADVYCNKSNTKYNREYTPQNPPQPLQQPQTTTTYKCTQCQNTITKGVYEHSTKDGGPALCMSCQNKRKEAR